ncbi:MAG: hypothetical protein OXC82_05145 [Rhodobacteraceae bacterium]|nr:hypothetical protein [Paracoccaceae bacterium]MCY4249808.1 hypothetical protein [Paracoccaceae bacterium]
MVLTCRSIMVLLIRGGFRKAPDGGCRVSAGDGRTGGVRTSRPSSRPFPRGLGYPPFRDQARWRSHRPEPDSRPPPQQGKNEAHDESRPCEVEDGKQDIQDAGIRIR